MPDTRFAIYYIPPEGQMLNFGASWLGWDIAQGRRVSQFDIAGLADITSGPRKYGFHGTLKPPFRLKEGLSLQDLTTATKALASQLAVVHCNGLKLTTLGRFLALVPNGPAEGFGRLANACVRDLDEFRAQPSDAELCRRQRPGMSERQIELLKRWGYPHVFEEFRFHMTLTGRMPAKSLPLWQRILHDRLPPQQAPFVIDQIALCAERADGNFELITRFPLGAKSR